MTSKAPTHRARLLRSPMAGVFATYSASGRQFARHWHDVYGFGLLDHGAQHWTSGRGPIDAYAGDVITTNPGEVHDGRPLGGPIRHWRIMSVDANAMAAIAGTTHTIEIGKPVIDDASLAGALRRLFVRVEQWEHHGEQLDALAFEESLVECCVLLMAAHGTRRVETRTAAGTVAIVRERLMDVVAVPTLTELADLAGISRFQLLRRFKAQYGVPPHAWLVCRRVEHARRLILAGVGLAEVASASGFSDQSHMTRVFVKHYGYTPGVWRASLQ
jgi:AraC-like DNA-binding protein